MKYQILIPIAAGLTALAAQGAISMSASADMDSIGAVVQRSYRGAMGEHREIARRPLYFQNDVHADETIETGRNGSTRLELLDRSEVAVGENAKIVLDSFVYDAKSKTSAGLLEFGVGAFRYVGGDSKHKEGLRLTTPVATIAIRGTELVIFVAPSGRTEINVIEGAISVAACGGGGSAELGAGQGVTVDPNCDIAVGAARQLPPRFIPQMPHDFASADDVGLEGGIGETDRAKDRMGRSEREFAPKEKPSKGKNAGGKGKSNGGTGGSTGGGSGGSTGGGTGGTGGGSTGGTGGQSGGGAADGGSGDGTSGGGTEGGGLSSGSGGSSGGIIG